MNTSNAMLTDEEITDRMASGDTEICQILIEKYREKIRFLVFKGLDNRQEAADDVCQEVFIALLNAVQRHVRIESLPAYVCQVCHHKIADWQREQMKKRKRLMPLTFMHDDFEASDAPSPAAETLAQEEWGLVEEAIRTLDDKARTILHCRYFEGMSYKQIARKLNDNPDNVRKICQRAREKVASKLEHDWRS